MRRRDAIGLAALCISGVGSCIIAILCAALIVSGGTPLSSWTGLMGLAETVALTAIGGFNCLAAWRLSRSRRWFDSGRCWRCGYDLTGNRSGVCPECGTAATR